MTDRSINLDRDGKSPPRRPDSPVVSIPQAGITRNTARTPGRMEGRRSAVDAPTEIFPSFRKTTTFRWDGD